MEIRADNSPSAAPLKHTGSWQPVTSGGLTATLAGCAWLMLAIWRDDDGFLSILDSFNLILHEAGHPLFSVFGESAALWGGTWMQLLIPLVVAGAFWQQRAALSLSIAMWWFFQNFLNVARYMADARAQELPLIGGGEHDWTNILSRHGLLEDDTAIASVVRAVGWIGMFVSLAAAVALWQLSRVASQRSGSASATPNAELRRPRS